MDAQPRERAQLVPGPEAARTGQGAKEFYLAGGAGTRALSCACSLLSRQAFPFPCLPNGHLWMELGNLPLFTTLVLWKK